MNQWLRKLTLLTASLLTLGTAASAVAPVVHAEDEQVLELAIGSEPPTIDPALATDSTSGAIIRNVFEGLTSVDENGEVQPGVAESWEVSEDLLTYTFKLREGAKWSNGDPVKASDFEYAWKRVLNPETASQYSSIMYAIAGAEAFNAGEGKEEEVGVKAIDDNTLEVKLAQPTPYFLELTAFYTYMPVHQATVQKEDNWAAEAGDLYVTNGAFSLEEWNHSSDYVLVPNEEYWDRDAVQLDRVNVQIIEEESTANTQFQAGALDYLGAPYSTVSLDAIDLFKSEDQLETKDYAAIYWYKVNTTDDVMKNVNIRKALALGFNRQGLVENVLKGGQQPATSIVPPAIEGFEEDPGFFKDADYDHAKEYLAKGLEELGMKDPAELTINLSINTSEAHASIAQYIQEEWAKNLGIQTQIDNSEWQVYLDKVSQLDYQVARLGWIADYNDASTFLEMYSTADNGNNDTGWENEEYKNLLDQAAQEADEAKRTELLKDAQAIIMEEMPVIPVYFYVNNYVVADKVNDMHPDALGNINLKYVSVNAE